MENNEITVWYKSKIVWTGIIAVGLSAISLLTGAGATVAPDQAALIAESVIAGIGAITVIVDRVVQHFTKK